MGNACCTPSVIKKGECNVIGNKENNNNEYNKKVTFGQINFDKPKEEEKCSILVNSFGKETNYLVSYKESKERKALENKLNDKNKK